MPSHCGTWDAHGKDAWYVGPALKHYQCYRMLIKSTQGIRIPPAVNIFPERCNLPNNSSADRILQAAQQLIHALAHPIPATPFEHVGPSNVIDLKKLALIFLNKANNNPHPETPLMQPNNQRQLT